MAIIKNVLLEEYERFLNKKNDYEEKLSGNINDQRREKIEKTLANITEDMTFIENSFTGNGLDIQKELIAFIELMNNTR